VFLSQYQLKVLQVKNKNIELECMYMHTANENTTGTSTPSKKAKIHTRDRGMAVTRDEGVSPVNRGGLAEHIG
jgi:hypothetical protein